MTKGANGLTSSSVFPFPLEKREQHFLLVRKHEDLPTCTKWRFLKLCHWQMPSRPDPQLFQKVPYIYQGTLVGGKKNTHIQKIALRVWLPQTCLIFTAEVHHQMYHVHIKVGL